MSSGDAGAGVGETPMAPAKKRRLRVALGLGGILLGLAALVFAGMAAWRHYNQQYVVERDDEGAAITSVVVARFAGASALKVGTLTGTVQASASDVRGMGMLHSDKVVKAPFSVDYFIDVARLRRQDLSWDATSRTLLVAVPDVTIGAPNVDEAARTVSETRGVYVTRGAADRLAQLVSQRAQGAAGTEARKTERLALARDNARRALASLLGAPLAAAGHGDVNVVLQFPWEGRRSPEQMDRSRSLEQVYANQY